MYNDPNQAPPPYGQPSSQQPTRYPSPAQPPPSPYNQPATPFDRPQYAPAQYVQSPYNNAQSLPPTSPVQPVPVPPRLRASRRGLWIGLGIAGAVVVAIVIAALLALVVFAKPGPKDTADAFYQAMQQQDYARAFGYVDTYNLTSTSTTFAQSIFVKAQQTLDRLLGPISSYTITSVSNVDAQTAKVVVSFTRKNKTYQLQYTLKKINGTWKVEL